MPRFQEHFPAMAGPVFIKIHCQYYFKSLFYVTFVLIRFCFILHVFALVLFNITKIKKKKYLLSQLQNIARELGGWIKMVYFQPLSRSIFSLEEEGEKEEGYILK